MTVVKTKAFDNFMQYRITHNNSNVSIPALAGGVNVISLSTVDDYFKDMTALLAFPSNEIRDYDSTVETGKFTGNFSDSVSYSLVKEGNKFYNTFNVTIAFNNVGSWTMKSVVLVLKKDSATTSNYEEFVICALNLDTPINVQGSPTYSFQIMLETGE